MDKIIEGISSNIILVVAIICYTVYEFCALKKRAGRAERYEELRTLNELREKGVITQQEFDEKS